VSGFLGEKRRVHGVPPPTNNALPPIHIPHLHPYLPSFLHCSPPTPSSSSQPNPTQPKSLPPSPKPKLQVSSDPPNPQPHPTKFAPKATRAPLTYPPPIENTAKPKKQKTLDLLQEISSADEVAQEFDSGLWMLTGRRKSVEKRACKK